MKSNVIKIIFQATIFVWISINAASAQDVSQDLEAKNLEIQTAEKTPAWKEAFDARTKLNQELVKQLQAAGRATDLESFRHYVSRAGGKLPKQSHIGSQLKNIVANVIVGEPNSSKADGKPRQEKSQAISMETAKERIDSVASKLAFRPTIESALPDGFPGPTTVGEIETKRYPAYRMATAKMTRGNIAFFKLFNHIQNEAISMTSPVEMTYEKLGDRLSQSTMAFLYPNQETGQLGWSSDVQVFDVPPTTVIVMGLRGRPDEQQIAKATKQLREAASRHAPSLKPSSGVRVMGYNSPSIPEENQFFEVQLKLRQREATNGELGSR